MSSLLNTAGNTQLTKASISYLRIVLDRLVCLSCPPPVTMRRVSCLNYLNLSGITFTPPMGLPSTCRAPDSHHPAHLLKEGLSSCHLHTLIMHRCGLNVCDIA